MKTKLIFAVVLVAIVGVWGYNEYNDYQEKKAVIKSYLQQHKADDGFQTSSFEENDEYSSEAEDYTPQTTSSRQVDCPACGGTGYSDGYRCPGCNGTGSVDEEMARQINEMLGTMESAGYISPSASNSSGYSNSSNECVSCNPSGDCSYCKGIGVVPYTGQYNTEDGYMICPVCKGSKRCTVCGGKHYL